MSRLSGRDNRLRTIKSQNTFLLIVHQENTSDLKDRASSNSQFLACPSKLLHVHTVMQKFSSQVSLAFSPFQSALSSVLV